MSNDTQSFVKASSEVPDTPGTPASTLFADFDRPTPATAVKSGMIPTPLRRREVLQKTCKPSVSFAAEPKAAAGVSTPGLEAAAAMQALVRPRLADHSVPSPVGTATLAAEPATAVPATTAPRGSVLSAPPMLVPRALPKTFAAPPAGPPPRALAAAPPGAAPPAGPPPAARPAAHPLLQQSRPGAVPRLNLSAASSAPTPRLNLSAASSAPTAAIASMPRVRSVANPLLANDRLPLQATTPGEEGAKVETPGDMQLLHTPQHCIRKRHASPVEARGGAPGTAGSAVDPKKAKMEHALRQEMSPHSRRIYQDMYQQMYGEDEVSMDVPMVAAVDAGGNIELESIDGENLDDVDMEAMEQDAVNQANHNAAMASSCSSAPSQHTVAIPEAVPTHAVPTQDGAPVSALASPEHAAHAPVHAPGPDDPNNAAPAAPPDDVLPSWFENLPSALANHMADFGVEHAKELTTMKVPVSDDVAAIARSQWGISREEFDSFLTTILPQLLAETQQHQQVSRGLWVNTHASAYIYIYAFICFKYTHAYQYVCYMLLCVYEYIYIYAYICIYIYI